MTYQIGDGSPISGHGPLWILKCWIHAYFPPFGANELKERLTSGSEENFACYVDALRLSPGTTCSFQECFEAFYTKETIEPFSERRFGPALFRFYSSYPPSGDTPEYPLYLTLWAYYLVARDLHYQVSMDPPNNTCGVELYSPSVAEEHKISPTKRVVFYTLKALSPSESPREVKIGIIL